MTRSPTCPRCSSPLVDEVAGWRRCSRCGGRVPVPRPPSAEDEEPIRLTVTVEERVHDGCATLLTGGFAVVLVIGALALLASLLAPALGVALALAPS